MTTNISSIYMITNTLNGKKYIGVTKNKPSDRWKKHISGNSKCKAINDAIKKYGENSFLFEVICQSKDYKYLRSIIEPYLIKKHNTFGKYGYNLSMGGEGNLGYVYTKEAREKMRVAKLGLYDGENNPACKRRKSITVTFSDGTQKTVTGIRKFEREFGYDRRKIKDMLDGHVKFYKDIIKVQEV